MPEPIIAVASGEPAGIGPELCLRLAGQDIGARLVIVTASPEFVVAPFAHGLGADLLIATRLAFDEAGKVIGEFDGANCRGPEKVVRLEAAFGPGVRLEAAYGDSAGDVEMLGLADEAGMKVFGERP